MTRKEIVDRLATIEIEKKSLAKDYYRLYRKSKSFNSGDCNRQDILQVIAVNVFSMTIEDLIAKEDEDVMNFIESARSFVYCIADDDDDLVQLADSF